MLSNIIGMAKDFLSGFTDRPHAGATHREVGDLMYHNKFSDFFPWYVYDEEKRVYHNTDNSMGMIWDCTPLCFASEKTLKMASALMQLPLPKHTTLQVLLHADPNIKPILKAYANMRLDDPLVQEASERYIKFLQDCTQGVAQTGGIPLRNYRLIVSLRIPPEQKVNLDELRTSITQILKSMDLWPVLMEPADLVEWLRRLLNSTVPETEMKNGRELAGYYDNFSPIGKQVLFSENDVEIAFDHVRIGPKHWVCMTPKSYPKWVDPLETSELFGGIWGVNSDGSQMATPFIYALNIIFDDLKGHLRNKCDLVLQQGAIGSFARSLGHKQEEYVWAVDKLDQGEVFARVMPILWLWHDDLDKVKEARTRAKYVWDHAGYLMQEDKGILGALLLASLPLGFRATKNNINMLERDIIAPAESIINILPIQADFSGGNEAVFPIQGRRGQLANLSIFSRRADNYNGFIAASSGKGKSFFMNALAFNQLSTGVVLRVVDLGGSYEKLCDMFNGRYMDFGVEASAGNLCMNPFTGIVDPEEDLQAIATIVMQMVYSLVDEPNPSKDEYTLAGDAVTWAYESYGEQATVDHVHQYLETYPTYAGKNYTDDIVKAAKHMAFSMAKFTSKGVYGKYFVGESTFNIKNDRFVVLELDALRNKKDLFKVVTLLVLDAAQRDLYLSDRSTKRQVIFDEAWQFLDGSNKMMMDIIQSGYRRARKYHGSFFIITQGVTDRKQFGAVGDIIWMNADFKFLLEAGDFDQALSDKLLNYDPFTMELLKSVKTNTPMYSEIFCDTPFGRGVVRLAVDRFSYFVYTSHPDENSEMKALRKTGMSWTEVIHEMMRRHPVKNAA